MPRPRPRSRRGQAATLYIDNLSAGSRPTMRASLDMAARRISGGTWIKRGPYWLIRGGHDHLAFDWSRLRHRHLKAFRAELIDRYAPTTVNRILAAVTGVLTQAFDMGLISADEYLRARNVKRVKGESLMKGRALAFSEVRALIRTSLRRRNRAVGARDAAMIGILYAAGLRRSELVKLTLSDYDPKTGELLVREAKGHKDRKVYLSRGARSLLARWLKVRRDEPGPLVCPVSTTGRLDLRHLSGQAIMDIVRRRSLEAGVRPFTPHDLRRTCASRLWDEGVDGVTIQRILGHARIDTTAKYDRRSEYATRAAAEKMRITL